MPHLPVPSAQTTFKRTLLRAVYRLVGMKISLAAARLLYHLKIEGAEQIPTSGACLFPTNHVSQVADGLVFGTIYQRRPDVFLYGWQGLEDQLGFFLSEISRPERRFQTVFENRLLLAVKARGLSAASLLQARQVLLQGGAISLAAEGEITWDGRLQHPLAPGAAWLTLRTATAVVPVVSLGGYDIQPRWQTEKIRLTGRVTIRVGQPFKLVEAPLAEVDDATLAHANQRIWEAMAFLTHKANTA